jgi:hypothetical protein
MIRRVLARSLLAVAGFAGALARWLRPEDFEPVSFECMFRQVWRRRGLSEVRVEARWQAYLAANPSLALLLERQRGLACS